MEMRKETYSKNCKGSQTHISIEIIMKLKKQNIWYNWRLTYLTYGIFRSRQTAQYGRVSRA